LLPITVTQGIARKSVKGFQPGCANLMVEILLPIHLD
jgi:hypothetical protein